MAPPVSEHGSSSDSMWTHLVPGQDVCADCQKIDVGIISEYLERCSDLQASDEIYQDSPADVSIELNLVSLETMRERQDCRVCQTFVQMADAASQNYISTWGTEDSGISNGVEWTKPTGMIRGILQHGNSLGPAWVKRSGPVLTTGLSSSIVFGELLLAKCTDQIDPDRFGCNDKMDPNLSWFQTAPASDQHPDTLYTTSIQLPVIRAWLDACNKRHPNDICPKSTTKSGIDIILIDVRGLKLVNRSTYDKYYTLSYVWGGLSIFRTLQANRKELEMEGALDVKRTTLPTVIREAMELVRALGDTYLWVDSLCISQDDEIHKHSQISQMDVIYGQAFLTIAATIGDASSCTSLARRPHFPQTLRYGNIQLTPRPKAWGEACLNASKYECRAWTLQERSLPRSCLVFTAHQMLMFCRYCGTRDEYAPLDLHSGPWYGPLAMFGELLSCGSWQEPTAWYWYNFLISEYTSRELSYPSDILNAFSGLATVLAKSLNGDFIYGLPEVVFDLSLLWTFLEDSPDGRRLVDGKHPFPTWSWAGWHGTVLHLHFSSSEQGFTGLPPLESLIGEFYIEEFNEVRLVERRSGSCSIPEHRGPDQPWVPHPLNINRPILHFKTKTLLASCFTSIQGDIIDCRDPLHGTTAEKERATLQPHVVTIFGTPVPATPNHWLIELSAARSETVSNRYWLMLVEWKDPCYERIAIGSVDEGIWKSLEPKENYVCLA
jgi:hypothetical protein